MSAPIVASPSRSRTPQISAIAIAVIFAIVASVILVALTVSRVGAPATTQPSRTSHTPTAIPSTVASPARAASRSSSSIRASPPAIPCTAASPARAEAMTSEPAAGFGVGYPVNGGLAGPSQVGGAATSSYGDGYPLHGGLAGPSRAEEGR